MMSDGDGLAFQYDGLAHVGSTWSGPVSGAVLRRLGPGLRPLWEKVVGGQATLFGFDADGLLIRSGDTTLTRHPGNGLITGSTLGDLVTEWTHNAFGEHASTRATWSGSELFSASYTRDRLGRITTKTETVGGATRQTSYRYDLVGRLAEVEESGSVVASYAYDANGNRVSADDAFGSVTASHDAQDRLLQQGSVTFAYNPRGDLESRSDGGVSAFYEYDVASNLRRVDLPDGRVIEYVIDGADRRIGKRVDGALVQRFLYRDQLNPIAELDGAGQVVSRFVYGAATHVPDYLVRAGRTYKLAHDHLGSVRLVVGVADGTIVQRLDVASMPKACQPFLLNVKRRRCHCLQAGNIDRLCASGAKQLESEPIEAVAALPAGEVERNVT